MPYFGNAAAPGGGLSPAATVTATKAAGNPTANFNCLIENPINVSGTYYAAYVTGDGNIYYATAAALTGPWTAAGTLYTPGGISWPGLTVTSLAAPFWILNPDSGNYTIFYDATCSDGKRYVGFCASATITGVYADHGSPILSPGAGGAWDSMVAGEPSVTYDASNWYMAYMGANTNPIPPSEKVGFASTPRSGSGISTTWTKNSDNPISYGAGGAWNEALMADPTIFQENGYFWCWCLGSSASPTYLGKEGLYYTTTPLVTASWTEHPSNPILAPTPATWDSARVFRGGILKESGIISGLYTGGTSLATLSTYKGGNFRLNIT